MIPERQSRRILEAISNARMRHGRSVNQDEARQAYEQRNKGKLDEALWVEWIRELKDLGYIEAELFEDSSGRRYSQRIDLKPEGRKFCHAYAQRVTNRNRWLVGILLAVAIPVVSKGVDIYRDRLNAQSALKKERGRVAISRSLEDFETNVRWMVADHDKAIDRIAAEMNAEGLLHSGRHVRVQYQEAATTLDAISNAWLECKREVEDALLESDSAVIADATLQMKYADMEKRAQEASTQVLEMTDRHFAGGNFEAAVIESAKKEAFEGSPSLRLR